MADEDGQEIAAIASPPPPPSSSLPSSNDMESKINTTIDMKDSSTTEQIVNHVLGEKEEEEEKNTPSLPSIESTSQPVSSLSSSSTTVSFPPSTTSYPSSVTSGLVPLLATVPAVTSNTTPVTVASSTVASSIVASSTVASSTVASSTVASSTAKRVILTPLSSAPCVQSNSLSSSFSPFSSTSVQLTNKTSSPTPSGHPVTFFPTSCPTVTLNNHLSATVPSSSSPSLLTRAVPASGYINQVVVSTPLTSPLTRLSSPITTGPSPVTTGPSSITTGPSPVTTITTGPSPITTGPSPITTGSSPVTGPSPDPFKSVAGVVMSGDNTIQTLKQHQQQLPNGTLSPSSSSSTVVITSSPSTSSPSTSFNALPSLEPPPRTLSSSISVPVATRGNIVTGTSSAIGPSCMTPQPLSTPISVQPSSTLPLSTQPSSNQPSSNQPSSILPSSILPSSNQPSTGTMKKNTNGNPSESGVLNPSPLKMNLPQSKPQTVFLTAKDGSAMVLQPSTTGGPPTLVPMSSTQNTQAISSTGVPLNHQTQTVPLNQQPVPLNHQTQSVPLNHQTQSVPLNHQTVPLNQQPVTSLTPSTPPRQVLVSNPNNHPMQQMIITRPGMQPQLVSSHLRPSLHPQPRFLLQQNPVRLPQGTIRPGPPTPLMPQRMSGFPNTLSGTFLVKTETGFQLVNVGGGGGGAGGGQGGLPPNLRFSLSTPHPSQPSVQSGSNQSRPQSQPSQQVMVTIPTSQMSVVRPGTVPINQPLSVQTPPSNSSPSPSTPSQMSPNTAKKKCKNFLSTLIRLASDQPEQVATNVRNLIQGLIDGQIPPEEFTNQLQRELNSSPQPCLIPFLKKSLPYLRHSLMVREMSIEGVRAPPAGSVTLPQQQQTIPQIQLSSGSIRAPMAPYNFVRMNTSIPYPTTLMNQGARQQIPVGIPAVSGPLISLPPPPVPSTLSTPPLPPPPPPPQSTPVPTQTKTPKKSKAKTPKESKTEKAEKAPKSASNNFSKIDDDDINDVAAMGGVNLQEEHLRMAASANEVGTQIRSCKDENFLFTSNLSNRINEISRRFNIPDDASPDVVSIVSHAAQEYLKTLAEKLGVIAEHRLETFKMNPKYEPTQDVRAQVKFLEELDRMEKKRHEEQEREMLLRAAKSRSKLEDPEQVKLKQKAKEMQRAELEEARQREANETALQAIGFRKKPRLDFNSSTSTNSFNSSTTFPFSSPFSISSNKTPIRRMKRVCLRDVLFLMEQERLTSKSPFLYKAYTK